MQSHFRGKIAIDLGHPGDIHEIFAKFEGVGAQVVEARLSLQPLRVMIAHHGYATSRRGHHMIVAGKNPEKPLCQRPRLFRTAGVGHGLAAAGLLLGELDVYTKPPEHPERGKANLRVELIDVARDEETYQGH